MTAMQNKNITASTAENLDFELQMEARGTARYFRNRERAQPSNTTAFQNYKEELIPQVTETLEEIVAPVMARNGANPPAWWKTLIYKDADTGKFEWRVAPYVLADIALMNIHDSCEAGQSEEHIKKLLGKAVHAVLFEAHVRKNSKNVKAIEMLRNRQLEDLDKRMLEATSDVPTRLEMFLKKVQQWGFTFEWSDTDDIHHGNLLYEAVWEGTNFLARDEDGGRMKRFRQDEDGRKDKKAKHKQKFPQLSEEAEDRMEQAHNRLAFARPDLGPMLVEPYDWTPNSLGPYRAERNAVRVPLIRNASPDQKAHVQKAMRDGSMNEALTALSYVQRVPFQINDYVFDALLWLFNNGKEFLDENSNPLLDDNGKNVRRDHTNWKIADSIEELPNLTMPPAYHDVEPEQKADMDPVALKAHYRRFFATRKIRKKIAGNQRDVERAIVQSHRVKRYRQFYLPHNFCSRGRVYHLGEFGPHKSDYVRALFLFANGKPVEDDKAVMWMKLQLANTWGVKGSIDERVAWVNRNRVKICLVGKDFKRWLRWWKRASEPMQFLAACHEWMQLEEAHAAGEVFVSKLPIGMDATQSGIQIYAAALRDPIDGMRVNLRCQDDQGNRITHPQDMYSVCLDAAKDLLDKELKANKATLAANPITPAEQAEIDAWNLAYYDPDTSEDQKAIMRADMKGTPLKAKINLVKDIEAAQATLALGDDYDRSVIKRGVMTYGYSSRQYGFAGQLRSDFMDKFTEDFVNGVIDEHPYGDDFGFHASMYLGRIHELAIKKTLQSVDKGMDFIMDCTKLLAENNKDLHFVTKTGFPFFQHYRVTDHATQKITGYDRVTKVWKSCQEMERHFPTSTVRRNKAIQGCAPNLVHSTDATLLLMTLNRCVEDYGVTNHMMIHDSFATTAADCHDLSDAVRQSFIELFDDYCLYSELRKQSIEQMVTKDKPAGDFERKSDAELEAQVIAAGGKRLTKTAIKEHKKNTFPDVPDRPTPQLNIHEVFYSLYFFS